MNRIVKLTFANGPLKGLQHAFHPPHRTLIGRASDCEMQLPNSLEFRRVSRHHCLLVCETPKVCDLNSSNGTYVNGVAVGDADAAIEEVDNNGTVWRHLRDGDEIRVGETFLKVSILPDSEDAHPSSRASESTSAGRASGGA
jgi:pSer/pThr/pTyr-binding forkhead associated (FHA) protein